MNYSNLACYRRLYSPKPIKTFYCGYRATYQCIGNAFEKLKHGYIITGWSNAHLSVHWLFQKMYISVHISTRNNLGCWRVIHVAHEIPAWTGPLSGPINNMAFWNSEAAIWYSCEYLMVFTPFFVLNFLLCWTPTIHSNFAWYQKANKSSTFQTTQHHK